MHILTIIVVAMLSYSGTSAVKDSCSTTDNTCSTNAKCVGEFNCECEKGFYDVNGDGKTCSLDICSTDLHHCQGDGAVCINVPVDDYRCDCLNGYESISGSEAASCELIVTTPSSSVSTYNLVRTPQRKIARQAVKVDRCTCYEKGCYYTPKDGCLEFTQRTAFLPAETQSCPTGTTFDVDECICNYSYTVTCPSGCQN